MFSAITSETGTYIKDQAVLVTGSLDTAGHRVLLHSAPSITDDVFLPDVKFTVCFTGQLGCPVSLQVKQWEQELKDGSPEKIVQLLRVARGLLKVSHAIITHSDPEPHYSNSLQLFDPFTSLC